MKVLVDTSVWIDYFRGGDSVSKMDVLIATNSIFMCGLILAELVPILLHKKQTELVQLLTQLPQLQVSTRWMQIINYQTQSLKNGFNHVGIPDLLLMDTELLHQVPLFTLDKHFKQLQHIVDVELY